MDPELKSLLTETLALAKDNHRMLRAIRRDAWFAAVVKGLFWVAIIVVPLYLLAPYLSNLPSASEFQKALNSYKLKS